MAMTAPTPTTAASRIPPARLAVIVLIMSYGTYGTYPARLAVAERVRECFARHVEIAALGPVAAAAPLPETSAIEALIDVGFWTSLRREEGYVPTVSLALVPPDATPHPLLFARPLPLSPA